MRDHSRIEELISARALGGLDSDDEAALARERGDHGEGCEECLRLEAEYGEVAGRLAFALDPVEVPEGLEERVVARTAAGPPERAAGPPRKWTRLVAVAASIMLVFAGWLARGVTGGGGGVAPGAFLRDAKLVRFHGAGGQLAMAYRPGKAGVYLFGGELGPPPAGHVYELWMIRGVKPVSGGCFSPNGEGGTILAYMQAQPGPGDTMAVTVESSACPQAPTTQPILTAQLGTA